MKNIFNTILIDKPRGNWFDLTHDVKLSLDVGKLVPILVMDCLPGDVVKLSCENVMRAAPMIAPLMHRVDVIVHYWFCPNRILWGEFEKFITGSYVNEGDTGYSGTTAPFITAGDGGGAYSELMNYMGILRPASQGGNVDQTLPRNISALPFAAYQKIYNDWYMDQNNQNLLIAAGDYVVTSGDNNGNSAMLREIRRRNWEHDYFTSCLPFAQKGAAVTIPLQGTDVPVRSNRSGGGTSLSGTPDSQALGYVPSENAAIAADALYADTSGMTATSTLNDLRRAEALQKWLESNARGGTRYTEHLKHMWGVYSSDQRLQRPEYITGSRSPLVISEVLNTTGTADAPQGNMSGHGIAVNSGYQGAYRCEEHGWIIGLLSIMPKTAYQQGMPRMFTRESPLDYAWVQFANIGEQEVHSEELYAYTTDADVNTFGYLPRYSEYKYMPSRVAGDFQTTLDFWHWGRIFGTEPALNEAFVNCDPDQRIFAVEEGNQWYCHHLNKIQAYRLLPKYGIPKLS